MTDNQILLSADDFSPLRAEVHVEQLSRPSLSYWQDAWIRLKKNKRAIISLYIVILLGIFTVFGPLIWTTDPSLLDVGQISQPPGLAKKALLVRSYEAWDGLVVEDFPAGRLLSGCRRRCLHPAF